MLAAVYQSGVTMKIRLLGVGVVLLALVGCSASPNREVTAVSPPESVDTVAEPAGADASVVDAAAAKPEISPRERDRILRILELLDNADLAIRDKRLTDPRGNSAADFYRQVLVLQPGFEEAERGLKTIVDRYVDWSDAAMRQGRLDRARKYLAKARQLDDSHPAIHAAAERLRQQGQRGSGYTRISVRELRVKSSDLKQLLGRLADQIRLDDARVIIEAPTDVQGRWIYQQLNNRHQEFRIRANLRLDPQPGIRLLY